VSDFPASQFLLPPTTILSTTGAMSSVGINEGGFRADIATNSAVFPAANRIFYVPVMVEVPVTVFQLGWGNGATVAGTVEVGIYSEKGPTRLVTSGAITMSGASVPQFTDITDTPLTPGVYYLAMLTSSATATFARSTLSLVLNRVSGVSQEAGSTLPTTPTFVVPANSFFPFICAALVATV
jgi:hypothetical protein